MPLSAIDSQVRARVITWQSTLLVVDEKQDLPVVTHNEYRDSRSYSENRYNGSSSLFEPLI